MMTGTNLNGDSNSRRTKKEWMDVIKDVLSYAIPKPPSWYLALTNRTSNVQKKKDTDDHLNNRSSEPLSINHRDTLLDNLRRVDMQRSLSLKRSRQYRQPLVAKPLNGGMLSSCCFPDEVCPPKLAKFQNDAVPARIQCQFRKHPDFKEKAALNRSLPSTNYKYSNTVKRLLNASYDSHFSSPEILEKRRKIENTNHDNITSTSRAAIKTDVEERYTFRKPPSLFDQIWDDELPKELAAKPITVRNDNAILAALASLPKKRTIKSMGLFELNSNLENSPADPVMLRSIIREEMDRLHQKITAEDTNVSSSRWTCVSCFSLIDPSLKSCPICKCTRNPARIAYRPPESLSDVSHIPNLSTSSATVLPVSSKALSFSSSFSTIAQNQFLACEDAASSLAKSQMSLSIGTVKMSTTPLISSTASTLLFNNTDELSTPSSKRRSIDSSLDNFLSSVSSTGSSLLVSKPSSISDTRYSSTANVCQPATSVSIQSLPQFSLKLPSSAASSTGFNFATNTCPFVTSSSHSPVFSSEKFNLSVSNTTNTQPTNQQATFSFISSSKEGGSLFSSNSKNVSSTVQQSSTEMSLLNNSQRLKTSIMSPIANITTSNSAKPLFSFNLTPSTSCVPMTSTANVPFKFGVTSSIETPKSSTESSTASNLFPSKFSFGATYAGQDTSSTSSTLPTFKLASSSSTPIFNVSTSTLSSTLSQIPSATCSGNSATNDNTKSVFVTTQSKSFGSLFSKSNDSVQTATTKQDSSAITPNNSFSFQNPVLASSPIALKFGASSTEASIPQQTNLFNTAVTSSAPTISFGAATNSLPHTSGFLFSSSGNSIEQKQTTGTGSTSLFGKTAPSTVSVPPSTAPMFQFGKTNDQTKPPAFTFGQTSSSSASFSTDSKPAATPFIFGASANTNLPTSDKQTIFGVSAKNNNSLFVFSGKPNSTGSVPSFGATPAASATIQSSAASQMPIQQSFSFPTSDSKKQNIHASNFKVANDFTYIFTCW
ncbi:hypothetical protein GJ496_007297 [Pomphorhynchus laevis]|nr:hypothetical protein GJ496_007297 [Pomphorhynchus laevis]